MNDNKEIKKRFVKRLVFEISDIKHKEIKLAATQMGSSMKKFIDQAIIDKIEYEKNK